MEHSGCSLLQPPRQPPDSGSPSPWGKAKRSAPKPFLTLCPVFHLLGFTPLLPAHYFMKIFKRTLKSYWNPRAVLKSSFLMSGGWRLLVTLHNWA